MPLPARAVDSALTTKGFKKFDNDHHIYWLYHNGKKTLIRTYMSHGEKEISDKNCGNMAKQMKLTGPEFREFVDCNMQNDRYVKLLKERQHLAEENPQRLKKTSSS